MKYNKYLLIVLSILILLVFVSSASAADSNKTEVLSIDESVNLENNTLALDSSSEISAGPNDNNVLKNNNQILQTPNSNEEHHTIYINATANPGGNGSQSNPFKTLNDALTDSSLQNNDIIMIASGTYTGENNTNLIIDKNLNFIKYGDGEAIFDAQELSRIWTVTATSINITCLTFKNGKAYMGGAIYIKNALSNSDINATFINNKATKDDIQNYGNGGALYFESDGTLTNCNFINNYAAENAGAVFINGEGNVDKCNFINNTANSLNWGGGGLFFNADGTVTNSYFSQNTAFRRSGGAFYGDCSANVKNCTFVNNTAPYGSAITIIRGAGNIENCNFTDNKATAGSGAGVFFQNNGKVINCNFINNTASMDGGAFCSAGSAEIINCNFTNNKALSEIGGAIQINNKGNVTNCNFINNTANRHGGAIANIYDEINVTNCNFINNTANNYGGAIYIKNSGNVINCNFTDNNAANGSVIYFHHASSIKTISNSTFLNNRADAEALEVSKNENNLTITFTGQNNLLNAIYSNGDVNFVNVTYWGANGITNTGNSTITPSRSNKEAGINITIIGIINDNIINTTKTTDSDGKIVLEDVTGDYLIFAHHDADSYYTQTNTSATNMQFYVNVTSLTTNNKTVNITAKSNIPNEILDGKLIFILPNSTEINATYTSDRTWWALHTFDDYGDYKINASYIGLDDVTVNNATISIRMIVPINTNDISIFVGDVATVVVTVPEAINGQNITITVNGTSKNVTVKSGEAKANFTGFSSGEYLITADYLGDDYYSANSTNATLTVSKIPTEISIKNSTIDLVIGDSVNSGATLTPSKAGNLTYTSSNPDVAIVEDGMIKGLKEGSTIIIVSFSGNEQYTPAENKTINVTVNPKPKQNLTINANAEPITAGENATVIVTGLENATGNITVTVNSNTYTAPIKDSEPTISIPDLTESVTAYVNYAGDNKYNNASTTAEIIVNPAPEPDKNNLTINATAKPITVGENATVIVTGLENATGNITVIINGKTYTSPIKDGESTISIPGLTESVTAYVNYAGDKTYNPASTTVNITINPESDVVVVADNVTKYYGGSERFAVIVYDSKLNPLANKTAYITINGITYTRLTDENGTTSIPLGLNSGQYDVVTKVDNTTVNSVVNILSTVDGSDIVKIYKNATKYYATFIDTNGKYLTDGTFVKFNINGIMYERKIEGGKGQAGLNINLPQGEYIITAINPANGEMHTNNITVLPNIADNKDIVKYYKNATQYSVKLLGSDGKAVGAGENVTFNVNGIFYTRQTNASGIATLNINLPPSNYIITADYKGCKVSNNITVLPVLNATDLKMKYKDGSQFKANLVDGEGKPYAEKIIKFNVNGMLYYRLTDSTGQAALNINLPQGEYIITSSFNGSTIANKITIS